MPWLNGHEASREGRAFVYYGNAGDGLDLIPRQARGDGSDPIDLLGATTPSGGFRVRALGRTPFGRGPVRLEVEVKPQGIPFDGTGILTTAYTVTGAPGTSGSIVPLERLVAPLPATGPYRWRARLRTPLPFPWQSRWMSLPYNSLTETDLRSRCWSTADCDDANSCTIDTCTNGACTNVPMVCTPPDQCHVAGTCDPATGLCSNPEAPGRDVVRGRRPLHDE